MTSASDTLALLGRIMWGGPSAADLLTVRALRRLAEAYVVLYANRISAEVTALCAPDAERVYAGKIYGDQVGPRQQPINEATVTPARQSKRVVRLKSGDPCTFGRAAEEIRYLAEQQVSYEVVSDLAAASLVNIMVAERDFSNAVLLCMAHAANCDFEQLDALANVLRMGNMLVMCMYLSHLPQVVARLQRAAGPETLYASAIYQVSELQQRLITARLPNIEAVLAEAALPMPVAFVFGKYAYSLDEVAAHLHSVS